MRQFKLNIVFAHVRQLYVHLTPVNKNMYCLVAMSFCYEEFYSSTVIERHFCVKHSIPVLSKKSSIYRASPFLVCLL